MTLLLNAKLYPDRVVISDHLGKNEKQVSPVDFAATLLKHVDVNASAPRQALRVPFGTLFTERTVNELFVAVYYPGKKHNLKLIIEGETYEYDVVLPNIVMEAKLTLGTSLAMSNYAFFCTNYGPDTLASRYHRGMRKLDARYPDNSHRDGLYHVPFTNMYDNGTMCLGHNSVPNVYPVDDISALHRYYDIMVNSPGNRDLPFRGLVGNWARYESNQRGLFKAWSGHAEFPYKNLRAI